jgi:uncharacterized protein (TIGR04255 family)
MKKIPKSISPTPIISASIEIKFNLNCPNEAVFGKFYDILKDKYNKYTKYPITNIPEQIRVQDGLVETPYYRFYNDFAFSVLVAPKLFVFVYTKNESQNYPGWSEFIYDEVTELYERLFALDIVKDVYRLGIRYNDFFKDINIFEHTTLNFVDSQNKRLDEIPTQIIQTKKIKNTINNIAISNNALVNKDKGSMIDIDTFLIDLKDFQKNYKTYLQESHQINKELFYSVLKDDFILTLNPKYGE